MQLQRKVDELLTAKQQLALPRSPVTAQEQDVASILGRYSAPDSDWVEKKPPEGANQSTKWDSKNQ
ncbi:MAG: hypothetical protein ABI893_00330 [Polaromonas sp.]|uniref:hypothetical protein n=1 Tax=Polaromonas sp. TaxID=1869339 RepID=UPI0032659CD7